MEEKDLQNNQQNEDKQDIKKPAYDVFMPNSKFISKDPAEVFDSYQDPEKVERLLLPSVLPRDISVIYNKLDPKELENGPTGDVFSLMLQTGIAPRYFAGNSAGGNGAGIFVNPLNKPGNKFTNDVREGSEELNIRRLDASSYTRPGVKQSEIRALHALRSALGKGEKTNIPLWHSGFRIVLNAPTLNDLFAYQTKVVKDTTEVGRSTLGFIYSNNQCISHKHFLDMVVDLLDSTTLDINLETDDIRNYISILDLNIIYLGVMSSISVSGMEVNISCSNIKEVVDGKPKCDYVGTVNLDPNKLLWVDEDNLENWQKKQMLKKSTGSVSLEEAQLYRDKVNAKSKESYWKLPIEADAKIYFRIPTVTEFLQDGTRWVDEIVNNVRNTITSETSKQEKEDTISAMSFFLRMATYNSFVDRVALEDNIIKSRDLVLQALSTLDYENNVVDAFLNSAMSVIEKNSIAIVAIPSFRCPKCKEEQSNTHQAEHFHDLIPIAIDTFFFDQVDLDIAGKSTNRKIETDQIRTMS